MAVGVARAAYEYTLDYAGVRTRFDRPIGDYQSAFMLATGKPFLRAEGSMAKLKASEVAVRATERALQIPGGNGETRTRDYPVERWARDAKI